MTMDLHLDRADRRHATRVLFDQIRDAITTGRLEPFANNTGLHA